MIAFIAGYMLVGFIFAVICAISYVYDPELFDRQADKTGEPWTKWDKFNFYFMVTILWPIGLMIIVIKSINK